MVRKAREGDVAAARLVLAYAIGRPTEAENPDRLDAQEWQRWQEQMTGPEDNIGYMRGVPVQFLNDIGGIVLDARRQFCSQGYLDLVKASQPDEQGQVEQECHTEQEPAPSTNGGNGDNSGGPIGRPGHNKGSGPVRRPGHNKEVGRPGHNKGRGPGLSRGRPHSSHKPAATQSGVGPSTNGDNGHQQASSAPSTNGANGDNGHEDMMSLLDELTRGG
jgi:hypothetical protein